MTVRERISYWAKRVRVRRGRKIEFAAKKRYWKSRLTKLQRERASRGLRAEAAAKVRYYDDKLDETADLLERAERGKARAQVRLDKSASANFSIREFDCKDGTRVPKCAEDAVRELCRDILEPMRAKFGRCKVNSGYRHRAYNRRIGGEPNSFHIYELRCDQVAADVRFERGTPAQWAAYARSLRGIGGVGQYNRSGFVHVDNGPRRDWWG